MNTKIYLCIIILIFFAGLLFAGPQGQGVSTNQAQGSGKGVDGNEGSGVGNMDSQDNTNMNRTNEGQGISSNMGQGEGKGIDGNEGQGRGNAEENPDIPTAPESNTIILFFTGIGIIILIFVWKKILKNKN